ncbi:hypothetical protein NE237_020634 [Protea cynaroides]|uniref:NYN domain-containing protein n=1 Tax=Protea cynaroides TaxID=273540 RepID=A0A9Q0K1V1_9MAGN|nr:hypothetical protein NE237_020634 [Protea cynaroides]
MFSAYGDCDTLSKKVRDGLELTGVNIIDVSNVKGQDGTTDRVIINNMHLFASDNLPSATLVLILGDVDFAQTLHKWRQRGHTIIFLIPSEDVSSVLLKATNFVLHWHNVVRKEGLVYRKPREFKNSMLWPIPVRYTCIHLTCLILCWVSKHA